MRSYICMPWARCSSKPRIEPSPWRHVCRTMPPPQPIAWANPAGIQPLEGICAVTGAPSDHRGNAAREAAAAHPEAASLSSGTAMHGTTKGDKITPEAGRGRGGGTGDLAPLLKR